MNFQTVDKDASMAWRLAFGVLFAVLDVHAYNLDVLNPIVFTPPSGGRSDRAFGYSVAMHQTSGNPAQ